MSLDTVVGVMRRYTFWTHVAKLNAEVQDGGTVVLGHIPRDPRRRVARLRHDGRSWLRGAIRETCIYAKQNQVVKRLLEMLITNV